MFALALDKGPVDHLLGADGTSLWAVRPAGPGSGRSLWRVAGTGSVQCVVVGDIGHGRRLYVARGTGMSSPNAPLVLEELDPMTGHGREIWRRGGERDEERHRCEHLSIVDLDGDGRSDLAFAFREGNSALRVRHLLHDGTIRDHEEVDGSNRAYRDLDGDGLIDVIAGGRAGASSGLLVDRGSSLESVPTDGGVTAVLVTESGHQLASLLFADGWFIGYGTGSKAQLNRVHWRDGKPHVQRLGTVEGEQVLAALEALDFDGDGRHEIIAFGSTRVILFQQSEEVWEERVLANVGFHLSPTLGRNAEGGWTLYWAGRPSLAEKLTGDASSAP